MRRTILFLPICESMAIAIGPPRSKENEKAFQATKGMTIKDFTLRPLNRAGSRTGVASSARVEVPNEPFGAAGVIFVAAH